MLYGILIVVCALLHPALVGDGDDLLKGMPEVRLGNIFAPPVEITFEPWVKAWAAGLHRPELRRAVPRVLEFGHASPCRR